MKRYLFAFLAIFLVGVQGHALHCRLSHQRVKKPSFFGLRKLVCSMPNTHFDRKAPVNLRPVKTLDKKLGWAMTVDALRLEKISFTPEARKVIVSISARRNNLQELLLSDMPLLESLDLAQNPLRNLRLYNLQKLDIEFPSEKYPMLTNLSMANVGSSQLQLSDMHLQHVQLYKMHSLKYMSVFGSDIEKLEIVDVPDMLQLQCFFGKTHTVEVKNVPKLLFIDANMVDLQRFVVKDAPMLNKMSAQGNPSAEVHLESVQQLEEIELDSGGVVYLSETSPAAAKFANCIKDGSDHGDVIVQCKA